LGLGDEAPARAWSGGGAEATGAPAGSGARCVLGDEAPDDLAAFAFASGGVGSLGTARLTGIGDAEFDGPGASRGRAGDPESQSEAASASAAAMRLPCVCHGRCHAFAVRLPARRASRHLRRVAERSSCGGPAFAMRLPCVRRAVARAQGVEAPAAGAWRRDCHAVAMRLPCDCHA